MDRRNVTGHDGTVHQALLNSHTGDFIDLACDAGRYAVVHHGEAFDQARLTDAALTCPGCTAAATGAVPHPADEAREYAAAVLAEADRRGYPPALDDEGMRLAFERLALDSGAAHPVYARLARGEYDPENSYRKVREYGLARGYLDDMLTERALDVAEPIPGATAEYRRFTGGTVTAPLSVGDRVMRTAYASGLWWFGNIAGTDGRYVLVYRDGSEIPSRYTACEMHRLFAKLDRAPQPAAV
ncbi:hypothetical protein [Streptomyces sp. NRRL S-455]|uniref:hypothetical protein n=1 Tax=Streptomyces sp. NRRL S-455 TaxID=1463908 RepID=UPI0004C14AA8|nr:hypothetical protein [Streptomyces sp. NRRL S-455]